MSRPTIIRFSVRSTGEKRAWTDSRSRATRFRAVGGQLLGLFVLGASRERVEWVASGCLRSRGLRPNVAVRPSSSRSQVEGSGTASTSMNCGRFNPETSEALYSPIVPLPKCLFATNKFPPDRAIPVELINPDTNEALIVAPVVALYSPIVPAPKFATNYLSTNGSGHGPNNRRHQSSPPRRQGTV
jgi:hypothetical protein